MNIYIVNGMPESGKTTFENLVREELKEQVRILSTVSFIKSMLAEYCYWNGVKDLKTRKLISDMKFLLSDYDDIPLKHIKEDVKKFERYCKLREFNGVIFIDCREPQEISKICEELGAKSILIRRKKVENYTTSNIADSNVFNYDYDIVIENNSDINNLKKQVNSFIIKENLK